MSKTLRDILISPRTLRDEEMSLNLGLYYALDIDDKFYFYSSGIDKKFLLELAEFFINKLASIDVYGSSMYTSTPIHVLKFRNLDFITKSHMVMYSNGAVCIDEKDEQFLLHIWIDKETINLYQIPKPEDLQKSN